MLVLILVVISIGRCLVRVSDDVDVARVVMTCRRWWWWGSQWVLLVLEVVEKVLGDVTTLVKGTKLWVSQLL